MPSSSEQKSSPSEIEHLRGLVSRLQESTAQLQLQNEALQKLVKQLQIESLTDDLTGVHNRRFFDREIDKSLASLSAGGTKFLLVLSDVDQLKVINDQHGHLVGDQVLKKIAQLLVKRVQSSDSLSRIGGDEFAIIMPTSDQHGGDEAVRLIGESLDLSELESTGVYVSLSFGFAQAAKHDTAASLFDRADRALYQSKQQR